VELRLRGPPVGGTSSPRATSRTKVCECSPPGRLESLNAQGDNVRSGMPGGCRRTENPTPFRGGSVNAQQQPERGIKINIYYLINLCAEGKRFSDAEINGLKRDGIPPDHRRVGGVARGGLKSVRGQGPTRASNSARSVESTPAMVRPDFRTRSIVLR
jgi:hypothetical protein